MKVLSYNVRKAIGRDGRRDPGRILDVVAGADADVVALQEADFRFRGRRAIFGAQEVTARTGLRVVDVAPDAPGLGWHGNLLWIGPRVRLIEARPVHLSGLEPRGAFRARLKIGGMQIVVVGAHLGLLGRHRRGQAAQLAEASHGAPQRIVVGDFNDWGRVPRSLAALAGTLDEAPCGRTFPTRRPIATLDRVFHAGPMRLAGSGVLDTPAIRLASDHLPVWARFEG